MTPIERVKASLRRFELLTRTIDPEKRARLDERWAELPDGVKTPEQMVGRHAIGCEGTHGVFPKCDLTCSPCYHSGDANKVRIDGEHTVREVDRQMSYLRKRRGPRGHAQLIGGEVSLLAPDDHAAALLSMRSYGREPMSMTHGDFDYEYLEKVALGADGKARFRKLSFAGHFDSLMRGRRGLPRPHAESELTEYRRRFVDMFTRLRREHGIRSYLAHNMTVTPENVGQIADVVAEATTMGYSMLSFQPAAFVGDDRRWSGRFRDISGDDVWSQIESGLGTRVPHKGAQMGDPRCNRSGFGFMVGNQWIPFIDEKRPEDMAARDMFYRDFGGMTIGGVPGWVAGLRLLRGVAAHPRALGPATLYGISLLKRAGGPSALLRNKVRPMTFVMHTFMDAADVTPAWELLQAGVMSDDPTIRGTQERLQACVYAMAHPESDMLVPACAQHSVLDPIENIELRNLLPIVEVRSAQRANVSADVSA